MPRVPGEKRNYRHNFARMKNVTFQALKVLGENGPDLVACARLVGAWESIVGANLVRHLHPARVEHHELIVLASSSGWLAEARFLEEAMLDNIAREVPQIRIEKIRFKLARKREIAYLDRGTQTAPEKPVGPSLAGGELPAEDEREIERTVARLEDESLREGLRRVLRLARRAERARGSKIEGPEGS